MTHPLTDQMIDQFTFIDKADEIELGYTRDDLRAAFDLAIERCVDWLEDNDCDDPQKTAKTLKEAMYSQEDNS